MKKTKALLLSYFLFFSNELFQQNIASLNIDFKRDAKHLTIKIEYKNTDTFDVLVSNPRYLQEKPFFFDSTSIDSAHQLRSHFFIPMVPEEPRFLRIRKGHRLSLKCCVYDTTSEVFVFRIVNSGNGEGLRLIYTIFDGTYYCLPLDSFFSTKPLTFIDKRRNLCPPKRR